MESHLACILGKHIQHFAGARQVVIEGAVKYSYILDSVGENVLQTLCNLFYTLVSYRLFTSAYTERAGIEAAPGGLQLNERLVPFEERAFFRVFQ